MSDALSVGFRTNAIDAVAQLKLPPIAEIALTVPGADADEDWRVFCTPRSPVDITIDPADGRTTILVPVGSAAQPGEPAWHAHSWIRRWCTGAESSTLTIAEGQWFELRGEAERHRVATPPIAISRTRRVAFALGDVLPSMIVRVLDPGGRQVTALDGEVFVECSSRGLDSNHRLLVDGVDRVGFGDILEGEPVTIHIVMADGEVFRRSLAIRGRNATLLEFERGQGELPTWLRIEQTFDSEFAALTLWLRGKSGPISYVERVESPCLPGPTLRQFHAESVALYRLPPSARTVWVTAPNGVILHAHSLGGTADLRGTRMDSDEFQINLSAVAIRRGLRQTVAFTYEVQLPFLDTTDWVVIDELTLQPERDQAPVVWQKTRPVHLPYRVRIHVSQQAPEIIPLSR